MRFRHRLEGEDRQEGGEVPPGWCKNGFSGSVWNCWGGWGLQFKLKSRGYLDIWSAGRCPIPLAPLRLDAQGVSRHFCRMNVQFPAIPQAGALSTLKPHFSAHENFAIEFSLPPHHLVGCRFWLRPSPAFCNAEFCPPRDGGSLRSYSPGPGSPLLFLIF